MRQKLKKIQTNFLFFLELQLLISVVMLPILIAWGLPISTMAIIGNLIFAQFLTAFIFVATILFTCDLIGISNTYPVFCLDWITSIWHYFLSFGSTNWLVGYPSCMFPISLLLAIAACGIYFQKKYTQYQRLLILIILCAATPVGTFLLKKNYIHAIVLQGAQKFHIIQHNGTIYAFDCGALGARPDSQSWIEYTLTPAMIKNMGATHIDVLVLCKSNSRTKGAVQALTECIPTYRLLKINQK